jgi:hypothetical protein
MENKKTDKTKVSISETGNSVIEDLQLKGFINLKQDGFLFAAGFAISQKIEPSTYEISGGLLDRDTSGIDPEQKLRNTIRVLYPESGNRPYAFLERLVEAGLVRIGEIQNELQGSFTLSKLLHKN